MTGVLANQPTYDRGIHVNCVWLLNLLNSECTCCEDEDDWKF